MRIEGLRVKYLEEKEKTNEDGDKTTYKVQLISDTANGNATVTLSSESPELIGFSPNDEVMLEIKPVQKKLNDEPTQEKTKAKA